VLRKAQDFSGTVAVLQWQSGEASVGQCPTLADGILDRLVHNAHRTEMRGDSMRKNRGKSNT
jgi:DNA replication protein DnaC